MPLLVLIAVALTAGLVAGLIVWRYPRSARTAAAPALDTARKVGETARRHPRLQGLLDARLDPAAATGLALTVALIFAIGGGVLLGLLAYLVRTNAHLIAIDNGVAKWGIRHASAISTHGLNV